MKGLEERSDKMAEYENMSYEDLVMRVQKQNDTLALEYLINNKGRSLIRKKTRGYFILGADKEDVIQEGMVGLYKAIRDFNADKEVSFVSFAELCINRQIISAIKAAGRQKHSPLNSSVSMDRQVSDDDDATYLDYISRSDINPEELVIGKESRKAMERAIVDSLSKMEQRVLALYLKGKSYTEIAVIMGKEEKSIDNALQRIKKKVEKIAYRKG